VTFWDWSAAYIMIHFSNSFVSALLGFLCILASIDLWRQYVARSGDVEFYRYSMGLQSESKLWKIGYRTENMEIRFDILKNKMSHMLKSVKDFSIPLRGKVSDFTERRYYRQVLGEFTINYNNTVEIKCGANDERLRVGLGNFRSDSRDSCSVYTGDKNTLQGPETVFEILDLGDEAFALRSVSNGRLVQVVPPGSGDSWDPWKLTMGGIIPGAGEKFRISPDGHLYSGLMGNYNRP
jgi:hypothetical protein